MINTCSDCNVIVWGGLSREGEKRGEKRGEVSDIVIWLPQLMVHLSGDTGL